MRSHRSTRAGGRADWLGAAIVGATFALSIPLASMACLFAALTYLSLPLARLVLRHRALFARSLALAAFCVSFYVVSVSYGFASASDGIKYSVACVGSYVLGFWYQRVTWQRSATRQVALLLGMAAGATLFAYLCSRTALVRSQGVELAERAAPNFWNPSELLNVPGLGAMASLGTCTVILAVFGGWEPGERRYHVAMSALVSALAWFGIQANVTFQNRSPFLALAAALALGAVVPIAQKHWLRSTSRRVAVALALVAGALAVVSTSGVTERMLFQRFEDMGLQSDRFSAWGSMAASLLTEPFGGRVVDVRLDFVHNLWLDVARDAGLVPFALLVSFHASHARPFLRFVRSPLPIDVRLVTLGIAVAYMVTFMGEPVLAFSPAYFAMSLSLFGFVLAAGERRTAP